MMECFIKLSKQIERFSSTFFIERQTCNKNIFQDGSIYQNINKDLQQLLLFSTKVKKQIQIQDYYRAPSSCIIHL